MKITYHLLLIALLFGANGCMSIAAISRAKGYTSLGAVPASGDVVFEASNHSWYVVPQNLTNSYRIPNSRIKLIVFNKPSDLPKDVAESHPYKIRDSNRPDDYINYLCYAYKPNGAFYFWLPITVPADIATSPFQLVGFGLMEYLEFAGTQQGS
jgi:hypothetical protein